MSRLRVRYQSLKEIELAEFETAVVKTSARGLRAERLADATRRFLVLCMVDGAGNRLYRDDQTDMLKDWDSADTQHLYNICRKFVGYDRDDIEELIKNSDPAPADSPPSDLPTD